MDITLFCKSLIISFQSAFISAIIFFLIYWMFIPLKGCAHFLEESSKVDEQ